MDVTVFTHCVAWKLDTKALILWSEEKIILKDVPHEVLHGVFKGSYAPAWVHFSFQNQ